jgi:hypothetical protein
MEGRVDLNQLNQMARMGTQAGNATSNEGHCSTEHSAKEGGLRLRNNAAVRKPRAKTGLESTTSLWLAGA